MPARFLLPGNLHRWTLNLNIILMMKGVKIKTLHSACSFRLSVREKLIFDHSKIRNCGVGSRA